MDETEAAENMKILTAIEIRERLVKNGNINEALRLAELMRWKAERELELSPHLPPEAFLPGSVTFAFDTDASNGSDRVEETGRYKPIDFGGESRQHDIKEMHRLIDLIFELKFQGAVTTDSEHTHGTPTNAFDRMTWNGSKADLGRVKKILAQHLKDCGEREWGRHFIGKEGEDMEDAVEYAKRNESARLTGEILALKNAFPEDGKSIDKK